MFIRVLTHRYQAQVCCVIRAVKQGTLTRCASAKLSEVIINVIDHPPIRVVLHWQIFQILKQINRKCWLMYNNHTSGWINKFKFGETVCGQLACDWVTLALYYQHVFCGCTPVTNTDRVWFKKIHYSAIRLLIQFIFYILTSFLFSNIFSIVVGDCCREASIHRIVADAGGSGGQSCLLHRSSCRLSCAAGDVVSKWRSDIVRVLAVLRGVAE